MAKSWIIDGKAIAKKVINASVFPAKQLKDCGAKRQCPRCHCWIDNSDVSYQWPGLPAGVKFDPSDAQLLDHLAAKCGVGNGKPHVLIDDFIPTLDTDKGICYTHPKDLPGARKDGNHIHFFHKTANAYASGQRKRRKILSQQSVETVRWHKTGKTKPVIENGVQKGYKKIMVLYRCSQKGSKPVKSNWAMHQYHLGTEEDEKEGEFVVSKIFYKKQKDTEKTNYCVLEEETGVMAIPCGPKTPKTSTPNPPRAGNSVLCDNVTDDSMPPFVTEGLRYADEGYPLPSTSTRSGVKDKYPGYLARESQAVDLDTNSIDDSLLCKEIFTTCAPLDECLARSISDTNGDSHKGSCGIADLENLELDTPPDFDLADLQFGSQDSILGWLDRW